MQRTENKKLAGVRAKLESDVEAFQARGGKIETVDYTANQGWRNRKKPGRQHIPLVIAPSSNKHPWISSR